jgi:hypothetical protein
VRLTTVSSKRIGEVLETTPDGRALVEWDRDWRETVPFRDLALAGTEEVPRG